MDEMQFAASAALSVGVELELQLVRPHDFDLSRDAGDLLARLAKRKLPGAVKPEITESMIELNSSVHGDCAGLLAELEAVRAAVVQDRKSTRLNSSHLVISYAVFCLKKKIR